MIVTRRFILAAAAFGASLSPASASLLVPAQWFNEAAMRFRALVPSPASAREIGRIYLAQHPEENSILALTRLIRLSMSLEEEDVAVFGRQPLSARLTSRVRADFETGLTVEVGGWILSRTEARLCALWIP